jgi:hypothetical protein
MSSKVVPENTVNNNWNYPISYFCIPIVCENNNIKLSCCYIKTNNKGCVGCVYCFKENYSCYCCIVNMYYNWIITPLCCYENDPYELFENNYCCPFYLTSSILIQERNRDNLYLHTCLGIWCLQEYHIHKSYNSILICISCNCCEEYSPCNYGFGIGPIGFTKGGNCFPFCWNLNFHNLNIFYKYLCCFGIVYKTPETDKGCSSGLPIYLKRKEIIVNNKKYIEEKGINYLLPWKVNTMV